ncbi:unnamed protein product [Laminaria digitata]
MPIFENLVLETPPPSRQGEGAPFLSTFQHKSRKSRFFLCEKPKSRKSPPKKAGEGSAYPQIRDSQTTQYGWNPINDYDLQHAPLYTLGLPIINTPWDCSPGSPSRSPRLIWGQTA